MNKLHRSEFLKEVKKHFPEIREDINKEEGLLSFEIDIFIKHVQNQIDSNKVNKTEIALSLLDKYYQDGNKSLHELIRNAVCEDLDFSDTSKRKRLWAYDLLSNQLKYERKEWLNFMGYNHV